MDVELKAYLDEQFSSINIRFETVATKNEITRQFADQTATLKAYADEQTEKLAAIINTTIAEPMEKQFSELKDYKTVREEVSILKSDVKEIKTALQLS